MIFAVAQRSLFLKIDFFGPCLSDWRFFLFFCHSGERREDWLSWPPFGQAGRNGYMDERDGY